MTPSLFERHPRLTLAAAIAIGSALSLPILEFGLRAAHWVYSDRADWYEEKHDGRAFGLRPNLSRHIHTAEMDYRVLTNDFGLRDDRSLAEIQRPGTQRILFLGDSFTFGLGVELPEIYSSLLEQRLRAEGCPCISFTAGFDDGLGPVQYEFYLQKYFETFQPDLVILGFFVHNDPWDSDMLITERDSQGHTLRQRLKEEEVSDGYLVPRTTGSWWERARVSLLEESMMARLWRSRWSTIVSTPEAAAGLPYFYQEGAPRQDDRLYHEALNSVLAIHRQAKNHGKQMIVFLIPSSFQIGAPYQEAMARYYGWDRKLMVESYQARQPQKYLAEFFRKNDISFIDPTDAFRAANSPGKPLHFERDGHWTKWGHAEAAKLIERYLLAAGWIPRK